jgi:hypothetical protein
MPAPPIEFVWTGEAMEPLPRFRRLCDQHYTIGETYPMVEHHERSQASHNQEFGWLKDAWLTLPDHLADAYPSPEHLRKRALIDAGYCTEQVIDAGSNAAALRVAAYVRGSDEFALVIVRGAFVVVRKAESQSFRAMGKERFQASKTAIIETVCAMLGVTAEALQSARAA